MDDGVSELLAEADGSVARGDMARGVSQLEEAVRRVPGHVDAWLKLASLRRALGFRPAALDAIGGALAADPLHFVALLSRARLLEDLGDNEGATQAYSRALARRPAGALPPSLLNAVAHAEQRHQARTVALATAWGEAIAGTGIADPRILARLKRFTTNATRETRPFHSEPVQFHYPGLAEYEFHDRTDFPWLAELEAGFEGIRAEYRALMAQGDAGAEPYVRYSSDLPVAQWKALNHSRDWTAFHLLRNGEAVVENAARCPHTMAVLARLPQPCIAGKSPNAMFSVLRPHTRIPPHVGVTNTRLVCHLPLVVPERCWFRVGAETRDWRAGEAFVFDDTIEHEAANDSDHPRAVLIIDVWHPNLGDDERGAITAIMEREGGRYSEAL